jgi:hypothetical protein
MQRVDPGIDPRGTRCVPRIRPGDPFGIAFTGLLVLLYSLFLHPLQ